MDQRAAESAAVGGVTAELAGKEVVVCRIGDLRLARLVEAWDGLSGDQQKTILRMAGLSLHEEEP